MDYRGGLGTGLLSCLHWFTFSRSISNLAITAIHTSPNFGCAATVVCQHGHGSLTVSAPFSLPTKSPDTHFDLVVPPRSRLQALRCIKYRVPVVGPPTLF